MIEKVKRTIPLFLNSLLESIRGTQTNNLINYRTFSMPETLSFVACTVVFVVLAAFVVKFLVDVILG